MLTSLWIKVCRLINNRYPLLAFPKRRAMNSTRCGLPQSGFPAFLIVFVNLPGLEQVLANAPLRTDTDTAAMLDAMQSTGGLQGWWRWFSGDWFLHNGFYRPTTCLSLLLDYTLYGEVGWGYRLTNWLLAVLTSLGFYALLLWFARRWLGRMLTDERHVCFFALAGAVALSLQQTNALHGVQRFSVWWWILAWLLATSYSHSLPDWGRRLRAGWWQIGLGIGAFFWGWDRLVHSDFERLIVWVPSRTALLSTCLTVWSLWFLLRWGDARRIGYLLAVLLLYAGACGAYEQPLTMVPLVVSLAFAQRGEWRWRAWTAAGIVVVIALLYLALRFTLLPATVSGYQQQQLRSSPALATWQLLQMLLPALSHYHYWAVNGLNLYLFFFKSAWDVVVADLAFLGVLVAFWRSWRWFGWWFLWQGITYLPMAFLHPFEHYYYLPQAGQNAIDLALVAWGMVQMKVHVREGLD